MKTETNEANTHKKEGTAKQNRWWTKDNLKIKVSKQTNVNMGKTNIIKQTNKRKYKKYKRKKRNNANSTTHNCILKT
jgi:hypothetical protein